MKYTTAKKQFFDFLKKNFHKRYLAAADILFYNIENIISYEKEVKHENINPFKLTEKTALNGADNWYHYSEAGCALCYTEDLRKTYYLDGYDINQYLDIQGELLDTVWKEWELFKYYRNLDE